MTRVMRNCVAGLAIASFFAVVTVAVPAQSAEPAQESKLSALVTQLHTGLLEIMKEAEALGFDGRSDKIGPVVEKTFDLRVIAAKTIGIAKWQQWTAPQKDQYEAAITRFLIASYADQFNGYSGQSFEIASVEDAPQADTFIVKTRLVNPSKDTVNLNYLVGNRDNSLGIIDIFYDGVSEVARRRGEFARIYTVDGFEALLASIDEKIGHLSMPGAEPIPGTVPIKSDDS